MAHRYIEIEVSRGLKRLYSPVSQRRRERILIQTIEHWGAFSTAQQRVYAPRGETGRILESIHTSHPRKFLPGGAGGGGTYEISSGVRRGIAPHAEHVLFGTAYGDAPGGAHAMTPGRIYSTSGRPLAIHKRGEGSGTKAVRWREWVSGQRPNNFVYTAYLDTSIYAKGQLRALAHGMLRPSQI